MKINLTKLLELSQTKTQRIVRPNETSASFYMKTIQATTSPEKAYSFELEKETFILDK